MRTFTSSKFHSIEEIIIGTDIHAMVQVRHGGKWEEVPTRWEQRRHYLLFAWLANVRNGFGFAGVPTHDEIQPVAMPRGLPPGVSAEDLDLGDHSYSWLLGSEILAAKRPGMIHKIGIVGRKDYEAWDGKSTPSSWCGGVSGEGLLVSPPSRITPATTHVSIEWDMEDGLDYFVGEIRRLMTEHGEIRLVFGFDS
jgi:hypothetical protein